MQKKAWTNRKGKKGNKNCQSPQNVNFGEWTIEKLRGSTASLHTKLGIHPSTPNLECLEPALLRKDVNLKESSGPWKSVECAPYSHGVSSRNIETERPERNKVDATIEMKPQKMESTLALQKHSDLHITWQRLFQVSAEMH
jgi:hypothetical protein